MNLKIKTLFLQPNVSDFPYWRGTPKSRIAKLLLGVNYLTPKPDTFDSKNSTYLFTCKALGLSPVDFNS